MQDSQMTDEWVTAQWKRNPCVALANGDLRTGPIRLSFPNLFKPGKPIPPNTEGKFGASLLFPAGVDISVLRQASAEVAKAKWPDVGTLKVPKLKSPFLSQDEDAGRYVGYEEGGVLIRTIANQKMPVVDLRLAPVVEESKVYPGVWALVTIRPFAYDKGVNKGVSFGLQTVMIVADDTNIGGTGSANPNEAFAGVSIDPGDINADAAFGGGEASVDPFA